jgi:FG-GAP-like repeat/FG-GAP repeat
MKSSVTTAWYESFPTWACSPMTATTASTCSPATMGPCQAGNSTRRSSSTVGDFNGDGKQDLFVFNGSDWSIPYLGLLASLGWVFSLVQRYDSTLPDWQMTQGVQHCIGDFNGDGKADLSLFNGSNWSIAYLGLLQSNGSGLSMATRYDGTVPGWQMRTTDTHSVADINGDGKADLCVYNDQD